MCINVTVHESRDYRGKVVTAAAEVDFTIMVGEGYDEQKLNELRGKVEGVINAGLPNCIRTSDKN